MGGPVSKRIDVLGPQAVNGQNAAGYGRSTPEKSQTMPSLMKTHQSGHLVVVLTLWYLQLRPLCEIVFNQTQSLIIMTIPKVAEVTIVLSIKFEITTNEMLIHLAF